MAVPHGDDAESNGLSGLVAPVRPVGGNTNLNDADTVLREQGDGKKGEESEAKHT
jgi:hypothetical protein